MPIYLYETINDNPKQVRRFEVQQRMADAALTTDPETGEAIRRVISGGLGFLGGENRTGQSEGGPAAGNCNAPNCGHSHH